MKRTKPEKKPVVVKAWCTVNLHGKPVRDPFGRYMIMDKRNGVNLGHPAVRRCRVIVE